MPSTPSPQRMESLGDAELMRLIGRGNRESFEEFHNRHAALLYATAYRVLNNPDDAEDVTQDTMFMVWEKSPMFDESRGNPVNWAVSMVRNKAIDRLRSIQRRLKLRDDVERETIPLVADVPQSRVPEILEAGEKRQIVRSAVMKLNREQREVIEMAYFGGLTQLEISKRLNTPIGTVKARIRRGMLRLKKLVGPAL